jgi:hypothetical protein
MCVWYTNVVAMLGTVLSICRGLSVIYNAYQVNEMPILSVMCGEI